MTIAFAWIGITALVWLILTLILTMLVLPSSHDLLEDVGESATLAMVLTCCIELVALGTWGIVILGNMIARAS